MSSRQAGRTSLSSNGSSAVKGAEENKDFKDEAFNPKGVRHREEFASARRSSDQGRSSSRRVSAEGMFEVEEVGGGDQLGAVKPFEGEVKNSVPTGFKKKAKCNEPPEGSLYLKHVFGYRCFDSKQSAKFLENSDDVFFITAALGVAMNVNTAAQRFFNDSFEDIISMDVSPDKKFAVTGCMPEKGRSKEVTILVWEIESGEVVSQSLPGSMSGISTA
jgi:hypothetical protein